MDVLITYNYRGDDMSSFPLEELSRFVLEREGRAKNTEVSVSFVDNETIAELNERYRGIEGPTDVLSFECDSTDDEVSAADRNGCSPVYELGDVIIAPDVAQAQSVEYGNTLEQEVSLLLVHGLLHLCGYDHIEDDEAKIMEAREAELLRDWVERDLAPEDSSQ